MTETETIQTDRRLASVQGRTKTGWEVSDIWDVHHNVKRRIFLGQKNIEIARVLGITKEQVSSIRRSPVIQDELKKLQLEADKNVVDVKEAVKLLAPKALRVVEQILDDENVPANVKLAAAKDTLDRGGHAAPQQVQHLHGHFTADDILEMKNRAKQLGVSNGLVVEESASETDTVSNESENDVIDV